MFVDGDGDDDDDGRNWYKTTDVLAATNKIWYQYTEQLPVQ